MLIIIETHSHSHSHAGHGKEPSNHESETLYEKLG